ncbi:hypothetical protein GWI33_010210 [Rhynchophorus ferrugineus]|uniref:Uncharacterized protein n=1 Tax=Rhynchophorus ferrugineus TaxID=354439 RepID=A0A834I8J9_RHYFE|nr:hypothetical protein GWI33_010210 [Rhynchophorus ferrugineus]
MASTYDTIGHIFLSRRNDKKKSVDVCNRNDAWDTVSIYYPNKLFGNVGIRPPPTDNRHVSSRPDPQRPPGALSRLLRRIPERNKRQIIQTDPLRSRGEDNFHKDDRKTNTQFFFIG